MTRWVKVFAIIGVAVGLLAGCVVPPGYGYTRATVVVGGPQVAFTFSDGVQGYYLSSYGTYVYGANGYYYRWVGNGWVYADYYNGPWAPVGAGVYLPPLLIYGPPAPTVAYRPYFIWWRSHAAPWYRMNHPRWWREHERYVHNYGQWHEHVRRFHEDRPGEGMGMRPSFHRPVEGFGHPGERFGHRPARGPERHYQAGPFHQAARPGEFRGDHRGPGHAQGPDHRRPRRDTHKKRDHDERY
ncbi:MAG TPA: hypothetical protein VMV40_06915 [Acidiferrobacter sp.]|nr:hypothetical protein [Acidiferrobacter sp.]